MFKWQTWYTEMTNLLQFTTNVQKLRWKAHDIHTILQSALRLMGFFIFFENCNKFAIAM